MNNRDRDAIIDLAMEYGSAKLTEGLAYAVKTRDMSNRANAALYETLHAAAVKSCKTIMDATAECVERDSVDAGSQKAAL